MSERLYTLAEARHIFAVRECAQYGHELSELKTFAGDVVAIVCGRCGERWRRPVNDPQEAHNRPLSDDEDGDDQ